MGEGGGEVADFELWVLDSLYLNDSSTSVVLRPDYTLELPGYTEQWDGHLLGCDLGPSISQSFPVDSYVQSGGNQCLPEVKERIAAESSVIHL